MNLTPNSSPGKARHHGFSLIEMIGVLAVLAISAAMLMPVLVQQTDSAVAGQEASSLQSFVTALQNNIERNRAIPTVTNWISVVATETGMTSNSVALTARKQPRLLLVDTNGFGTLTLPYSQTSNGATNVLTNSTPPRFIIISSLGKALPTLVGTNGFPSSTNFNALWNAASGTLPSNSGSPWLGWQGNPKDLTIQRLDLAYLFAHLVLNNTDPTNAPFSIDGFPVTNLRPTNQLNAYFLINTVLNLDLGNTNLEAAQVLLRDSSWVFSGGIWRNTSAPASISVVDTVETGGVDSIVKTFCTNSYNPWSRTTPMTVYNDFTNYMGVYQQYAAGGFTNATCRNQLQSCCNQLNNNDIPNLCSH